MFPRRVYCVSKVCNTRRQVTNARVEMSEDAGSLPSKDSHVTTWFDEHFSLTDGAFRKTKSTYEK